MSETWDEFNASAGKPKKETSKASSGQWMSTY
ncbi:hypothetical protein [Vibrio phage vB_pir03]|nr:hypothetical protein [Vibrio phage vB_pir03]